MIQAFCMSGSEIVCRSRQRIIRAESFGMLHNPSAAAESRRECRATDESGFSLTEMLMSSVILLVISLAVFGALNGIQQTARCQAEIHRVLDNARNALQTTERYIRQAGNDPLRTGLEAISIVSPTEVRIRSDITGSRRRSKGDPDGDTDDSRENILLRFNSREKRLEMVSRNGPAQIIAENISDFSLQYFDEDGNPTGTGSMVRKITISISGTSIYTDPRTGKPFGVKLESTVRIRT